MPAWAGSKIGFADVAGDLEAEDGAAFAQYVIDEPVSGFDYVDTGKEGDYDINVDFAIQDQAASPDDDNQIEVKIEIQLSEETGGAPSFEPYQPYLAGEYFCRYYRLRATVQVDPVFGQIPEVTRFQHHHVPVGSMATPGSIDLVATVPSGLEATGARYIVGTPATGDFTDQEDLVAYLPETTDRNWRFHIPVDGERIYDKSTRWWWKYEGDYPSGSWVPRDHYRNFSASEGLSSTSNPAFQQKHTMTTIPLWTGALYRIGYQFEVGVNSTAARSEYQVQIDNSITIAQPFFAPGGGPANVVFDLMSGFYYYTGTGVSILIDIDFRRASAAPGDIAKIRRARIEIQRVE